MTSNMFNSERVSKFPKEMRGERTVHRETFSPSSANPGDTIRVELPSLSKDMVFVPKSLKLRFNLEVDAGKDTNHAVFNVSRNLVDNFSVKIGKHTICNIGRYDLYEGYHDLLKVNHDMKMGITSEAYRKIRANASDKSTDAKMVEHCSAYENLYHISLSHPIIDDHGCYNSRALEDKIWFELRLANKGDIVITSDLSKAHSFKLNNIEFEYTTMKNEELVDQISSTYENGRTFFLEDVNLFKIEGPLNFSTQKTLSTRINMSLKSMKGVLFLFTKTYTAGARNTEEFINPKISSIKSKINGISNLIYSSGIKSDDGWENILKKVGKVHNDFKEIDFLNHKFASWVDLRAAQENMFHGDGKKFGDNGNGLVINITLKSTETSVNCYVFVVSDAAVYVQDGRVKQYII